MVKVGHLGVEQDGNPKEREGEYRDWFDQQHDPCRGAGSMGGGLIWILEGGRKAPLGRVSKEGGILPHPPSFRGVERG